MKESFYISFGVWVAIVPFLGIPGAWRNTLVTLSGLFLVLVALGPILLKKLQTKPKAKPRKKAELKFSDAPLIGTPQAGSDVVIESKNTNLPEAPL